MSAPKGKGEKPQVDKFKDAARELETDDREEAFDEKLKRVAVTPKKKVPSRGESGT